MAVLGMATIIIFCLSIIMASVTGRKQLYINLIWCLPILGLVYSPETQKVINGLVVVICFTMMLQVVYSVYGIKLWCTQTRKKNKIASFFSLIFNFIFSAYCIGDSIALGYILGIPEVNKVGVVSLGIFLGLLLTLIMQNVSLTVLERYFSKKEDFPLIKSRPLTSFRQNKFQFNRIHAIKGVQNGETYVFNMTKKAFLVLKPENAFVFPARRGFLGSVFVNEDIYGEKNTRRVKRANKILLGNGIFASLVAVLIILLVLRIIIGSNFSEIFLLLKRGVAF